MLLTLLPRRAPFSSLTLGHYRLPDIKNEPLVLHFLAIIAFKGLSRTIPPHSPFLHPSSFHMAQTLLNGIC